MAVRVEVVGSFEMAHHRGLGAVGIVRLDPVDDLAMLGQRTLVLARERMQSIATKIRTRAALSAEERQFVANVRTLPVYRMLEWGVRQGVVASVIGDTDELVALTLAYPMLNDLPQIGRASWRAQVW